jgi:hypothetical protein
MITIIASVAISSYILICAALYFLQERLIFYLIPHGASERLAALVRTEHELITIVGGGHNDLGNFEQYDQQLDRILRMKISSAGITVLL